MIIIEADKNVGYVCIKKTELIEQYTKINIQQHFGSTNVSEECLNFIQEWITRWAQEYKYRFWFCMDGKSFWDGRLQPKVLKLPEINASNVPLLRSRGIKSSMRDPIRIIQKILDTIFNHLLFHIENQFISQFGVFSPSVLGVHKAIFWIKNRKLEKLYWTWRL